MVTAKEQISFRIPEIGEICIEEDGDTPFCVVEVNHGLVYGLTPMGDIFSCRIESEPHILDQFDL